MKFLPVRDLRSKSADVWKGLTAEREMVVTSNGRPSTRTSFCARSSASIPSGSTPSSRKYEQAAFPSQATLSRSGCPPPDDEPFLEIALAGEIRRLVTGNGKHYPAEAQHGVEVLSPRSFIERYREE